MVVLTAYRYKVKGARGGIKVLHGVKRDGVVVFDGGTRREAQSAFAKEQGTGVHDVDYRIETVNWYGRF